MSTQARHRLETAVPGLHATRPEPLPFAPHTSMRAMLLERRQGNLLLYASPAIDADREAIKALGGAEHQYLSHWHEAMFESDWQPAQLFVHEAGRAQTESRMRVRGTWDRHVLLEEDFEAIPIPGHTPDATAFLWNTGRHRVLFTGDSLTLEGDDWAVAVLDSSDPATYAQSLERIRDLEFDVLAPWAAADGEPWVAVTSRTHTRRQIDRILTSRRWDPAS